MARPSASIVHTLATLIANKNPTRKDNKLRSSFIGYYPPTESERLEIWSTATFVFDTNTLLNLFRYTPATRDEFLNALENYSESLWLPHQVVYEFHRRRHGVIKEQSDAFGAIRTDLKKTSDAFTKTLDRFRRHSSIDVGALADNYQDALAQVLTLIDSSETTHQKNQIDSRADEAVLNRVSDLFEGKVGDPFSEAELAEIYADGKARYEAKVPPGYKDVSKPEPDRYGDLVLWRQIIRNGKDATRPTIFVTDDQKEDWWWVESGRTLGPRVELVEEHLSATGSRVLFYTPERFLQFATNLGSSEHSDEALSEIESLSRDLHAESTLAAERDYIVWQLAELAAERNSLVHHASREPADREEVTSMALEWDLDELQSRRDSLIDEFLSLENAEFFSDGRDTRHKKESRRAAIEREVRDVDDQIAAVTSYLGKRPRSSLKSDNTDRLRTLDRTVRDLEAQLIYLRESQMRRN